jgi:hypothetical protein
VRAELREKLARRLLSIEPTVEIGVGRSFRDDDGMTGGEVAELGVPVRRSFSGGATNPIWTTPRGIHGLPLRVSWPSMILTAAG